MRQSFCSDPRGTKRSDDRSIKGDGCSVVGGMATSRIGSPRARRGRSRALGPPTGSIVMMNDVMVIVLVMGTRRCGSGTRYGAHAPADSRTDTSTTTASRDRTDYGPGAGADQPSSQRSLGRIVGVRERSSRQHQRGADYAGDSRLLSHFSNPLCYSSEQLARDVVPGPGAMPCGRGHLRHPPGTPKAFALFPQHGAVGG